MDPNSKAEAWKEPNHPKTIGGGVTADGRTMGGRPFRPGEMTDEMRESLRHLKDGDDVTSGTVTAEGSPSRDLSVGSSVRVKSSESQFHRRVGKVCWLSGDRANVNFAGGISGGFFRHEIELVDSPATSAPPAPE